MDNPLDKETIQNAINIANLNADKLNKCNLFESLTLLDHYFG